MAFLYDVNGQRLNIGGNTSKVPFTDIDVVLLKHVDVAPVEGTYPDVVVSTDTDGQPFDEKGILIVSDVSGDVAYIPIWFNNKTYIQGFRVPKTTYGWSTAFFASPDGTVMQTYDVDRATQIWSVGRKLPSNNAFQGYTSFNKVVVGWMSAGTFVDIYAIRERSAT